MKRLPISLLIFCFFLINVPAVVIAQPGPCDDPFGPLNCDCPENQTNPSCPIDGGLSLLIAAGLGIGARKAYQEKKKAAPQDEKAS